MPCNDDCMSTMIARYPVALRSRGRKGLPARLQTVDELIVRFGKRLHALQLELHGDRLYVDAGSFQLLHRLACALQGFRRVDRARDATMLLERFQGRRGQRVE